MTFTLLVLAMVTGLPDFAASATSELKRKNAQPAYVHRIQERELPKGPEPAQDLSES